jgi:hypothetical protein
MVGLPGWVWNPTVLLFVRYRYKLAFSVLSAVAQIYVGFGFGFSVVFFAGSNSTIIIDNINSLKKILEGLSSCGCSWRVVGFDCAKKLPSCTFESGGNWKGVWRRASRVLY